LDLRFLAYGFGFQLQVTDVLQQLDDDWGSLACPSSDSQTFWNHEWSKHGTCSGLSQHDYFQSAINLYGNYDITTALANAGTYLFTCFSKIPC
jgi:ribonuclease T2